MSNQIYPTSEGPLETTLSKSPVRTVFPNSASQEYDAGYIDFLRTNTASRKVDFHAPEVTHFWNRPEFWAYFGSTALVGVLAYTFQRNKDWFDNLSKPAFLPSSKTFPFIWAILYALMAGTTYLADVEIKDNPRIQKLLRIVFGIQLFLNLLWHYTFFALRNPAWALGIMIVLIVAAFVQMLIMFRINKILGLIFGLYVLGLIFTLFMNIQITSLNPTRPTVSPVTAIDANLPSGSTLSVPAADGSTVTITKN